MNRVAVPPARVILFLTGSSTRCPAECGAVSLGRAPASKLQRRGHPATEHGPDRQAIAERGLRMYSRRWKVAAALSLAFAMGAVTAVAQSKGQVKKAGKLLSKIKLVDGAGSGLDADMVQGMTPAQIQASLTPGPPGPPGPQGPVGPSGGGLRVVDASGREVGLVASLQLGDGETPYSVLTPRSCASWRRSMNRPRHSRNT